MTTSTTPPTELPVLDDLTTAEVRDLVRAHLGGVHLRVATAVVRVWGIGQGVMAATADRGPIARAVWLGYAEVHRLGIVRPPDPAVPAAPVGGAGTASRCRCSHLRIDHRGGERCRPACGCLRFRRAS